MEDAALQIGVHSESKEFAPRGIVSWKGDPFEKGDKEKEMSRMAPFESIPIHLKLCLEICWLLLILF